MSLVGRVANAYEAFTNENKQPVRNSGRGTAADFLRYGNNRKPLQQEWSQIEMSDQDMYTGYSYAAIKKRANRASALGKRFLYTEASPAVMDAAKKADKELEHPYLELIRKSKDFSRRKFWHDISTYLDLEGVYYLMAVRAIRTKPNGDIVVGAVQKFQMLNPYQIRRVVKQSDGTLGGYIESKDGLYREIPKEMIIEIRLLNPFDNDLPYSMTDAAKESQFTMKQAGDYTRHSIKGNINAPGAITTGVELEDHIFDNFVSRIENHTKGEPLYGNGTGAINWSSMQIDLDKAGLDKINEINRAILFAVSGTSKTAMGIEESGTGREVSKTQRDDFTENAVMPQIEDILDALNLDYRRYYDEWEKDEYEILLDNPLETDREAELKDIEIRQSELDLRDALVAKGYEYEVAAKYAHGDISLEELGEPTLEPELSDEDAELQARREMGEDVPEDEDAEPENGNEVDEIDRDTAANRSLATNKFVTPDENAKKVSQMKKKLKATPKKAAKDEEKERGKEAEEDSEEIIKDDEKKNPDAPTKDKKLTDTKKKKKKNELERSINQVSIREDFPDLYEGLVVDPRAVTDDKYRGCIMINTEVIPVTQFVKDGEKDLVHATDRHDHTMGAVAEVEPHATLLYGLLNNGNIWKDKVDQVLTGWEMPTVTIKEVSYFDLGDSKAVIGLLEETPEIIDANQRLSLLPHLNTFSEYHPHVTLAYINDKADVDKWVKSLGKKYNGQIVSTKGLNYGDPLEDDDTDAKNHVEDEHDMENLPKAAPVKKKIEDKQQNSAVSSSNALHTHDGAKHEYIHDMKLEAATNALEPVVKDEILLREANLQHAVAGLDRDVVNKVLEALRNGNVGQAKQIISEAEEGSFVATLAALFGAYYLVTLPIFATQLLALRLNQTGKQGIFAMTDDVKQYIEDSSHNAAESHINTIIRDLERSVDQSTEQATNDILLAEVTKKVNERDPAYLDKLPENPNTEDILKAVNKGKFDDSDAYAYAREQVRQGEGLNTIVRAVQEKYKHISENRAKTIARHESSRVFNMSQYQADVQFLVETNNMDKAYKRLRSRNDNPCPVCNMLILQTRLNPIPFEKNFADLGTELTANYKKPNGKLAVQKVPISYEAIKAGNVHVNCNCEYELVIKQDDGKFLNQAPVDNGFDPDQPRDEDGKWTGGTSGVDSDTGMGKVDLRKKYKKPDFSNAQEDAKNLDSLEFRRKYLLDQSDPEIFKEFLKDSVKGNPSEDEDAIEEALDYQATSFLTLNKYLGNNPDESQWNSTFKRITKSLDKAFTWELTKDAVTYRKLSADYYSLNKVGQQFTEPNYGSTSLNPAEANQDAWGQGPILVIDIPKGQKVSILDLYSGTADDLSVYGQQEVLMPRNTKYEVVEVIDSVEYHQKLIRVKVVN